MAVFVEAGRGRREGDARKSISGAVRGSPGQAVQAGIRGIDLIKRLKMFLGSLNKVEWHVKARITIWIVDAIRPVQDFHLRHREPFDPLILVLDGIRDLFVGGNPTDTFAEAEWACIS